LLIAILRIISLTLKTKKYEEDEENAYAGNVNRNQGAILAAADGVSQVGLYFALAGTGATAGASLIVGLAVSA
jgi:hypothetical protein